MSRSALINSLKKISTQERQAGAPDIMEANIVSLGNAADKYTIKLRNGARISNVQGPTGYSVGNSVVVAKYPGRTTRYVILGRGYGNSGTILTVSV